MKVNALLLEPLGEGDARSKMVYQPCRLLVHHELHACSCAVMQSHVKLATNGQELPPLPSEWMFDSKDLRRISLHNEDELCLYMYAELSDFQLFFPSTKARELFYRAIRSLNTEATDSYLPGVTTDAEIRFEYNRDEHSGQKKKLGSGSFGTVYSAMDLDTKNNIAVKEIPIKNTADLQPLQEEVAMHKRWQHPHIVRYLGSEVKDNVFRIFMEEVPGGSLSNLLRHKWGPLDEDTIRRYTYQILKGLAYLHDHNVVHRDIKGDNVLVDRYNGKLKLSDFGTSKRLASINPKDPVDARPAGTPPYMAPEVINSPRAYGLAADIWSLGCTVIEMATG